MNDLDKVIRDYIESSIKQGIALEEGNANKANRYYRRIRKRIKWLDEKGELGEDSFSNLLSHPNDYVKYHTAYALLHKKEDMAIDMLVKISERKDILGFSAEMTISEFKKGNI